jgi:hypothetical protein
VRYIEMLRRRARGIRFSSVCTTVLAVRDLNRIIVGTFDFRPNQSLDQLRGAVHKSKHASLIRNDSRHHTHSRDANPSLGDRER